MIAALADFVPVAANTACTQWRDDDALKRFFHQIVDPSDWKHAQEGDTTQGMYACGSDGALYSFTFEYDVARVLGVIEEAKGKFAKGPPKKVALRGKRTAFELPPPAGTLVAAVYARISPVPTGAASDNAYVGRDHLWILPEEIAAMRRGEFPKALAVRLARWHLWDNVRGEPDAWAPGHVKKADFHAQAVSEEGALGVKLSGEFSISAPAGLRGACERKLPASGYEGTLTGEIAFDPKSGAVTRFVLLVEGQAWGESTFTPGAPEGKFPLRIAFVLPAPEDPTNAVPPQGISGDADAYLGR